MAAPPIVPGYRMLQLLGAGGFAEVWKAEHESLGLVHAVKVLHPPLERRRATRAVGVSQLLRAPRPLRHPRLSACQVGALAPSVLSVDRVICHPSPGAPGRGALQLARSLILCGRRR